MRFLNSSKTDICIIGAGASGMTAAIAAAEAGAEVCLIESGDRGGRKILKTGNGKCNLSHTPTTSEAYHGSGRQRIDSFLGSFGTNETKAFFERLGLITRERDGYVYPYSEQASVVLDVLRYNIGSERIRLMTEIRADMIRPERNCFCIGNDIKARRVILAAGGMASPETGSDGSGLKIAADLGLRIVEPFPALTKLTVREKSIVSLFGVRAKGKLTVYLSGVGAILSDRGEIQFTKDSISGIPVFNISGEVIRAMEQGCKAKAVIDLIPEYDESELCDRLNERITSPGSRSLIRNMNAEQLFTGLVHKKLCLYAMDRAGIRPSDKADTLEPEMLHRFIYELKNLTFNISSYYGYEQAQVMSGGVHFDEVDDDLRCVRIPGLYLAGELLDIDGICGGYNLQWAWTSGYIAGKRAAESL